MPEGIFCLQSRRTEWAATRAILLARRAPSCGWPRPVPDAHPVRLGLSALASAGARLALPRICIGSSSAPGHRSSLQPTCSHPEGRAAGGWLAEPVLAATIVIWRSTTTRSTRAIPSVEDWPRDAVGPWGEPSASIAGAWSPDPLARHHLRGHAISEQYGTHRDLAQPAISTIHRWKPDRGGQVTKL
jgi:hypothetical protein